MFAFTMLVALNRDSLPGLSASHALSSLKLTVVLHSLGIALQVELECSATWEELQGSPFFVLRDWMKKELKERKQKPTQIQPGYDSVCLPNRSFRNAFAWFGFSL